MSETKEQKTSSTKPLPPGMVLGPDGKPCKICSVARTWASNPPKIKKAASGTAAAAGAAGAATASATSAQLGGDEDQRRRERCPPDVEQLGRATWTFLHTTAAYYPETPSQSQKSSMLGLLKSLPVLYPCSHCATHLSSNLKEHPITEGVVANRFALSRWLCERHNDVNVRLGKPEFDCGKTDERWKDGPSDGSCD